MGDEAGAALIVGSLKARGIKPPDTTNDLGQCSSCFCRFKVGQQVYESPDAKVCESCFLQSAPKCGACGKPVIGTVARVGETAFHPDCLVCSGCGQKLTGAFAKTDSGFKCANCRP
ncbi:unnamed protein product [Effrenium voratum]|nr:unnamed protein product [Effrenium voratum]